MAKDKKGKEKHKHPIKTGDKFLCPNCSSEVPVKQACPACLREIDWTRV
jgi:uncharacterized protein (DUF983 family)